MDGGAIVWCGTVRGNFYWASPAEPAPAPRFLFWPVVPPLGGIAESLFPSRAPPPPLRDSQLLRPMQIAKRPRRGGALAAGAKTGHVAKYFNVSC